MKHTLDILVIDCNPITFIGYTAVWKEAQFNFDFSPKKANNCDEVLQMMKRKTFRRFDIVFLEAILPPSKNQRIINGLHLGIKIKEKYPSIKIVVQTPLKNQQSISEIIDKLGPNGFLNIYDLDKEMIADVVSALHAGKMYYSPSIKKTIRAIKNNSVKIDILGQQILYLLSKGEKMKDLPKHIPLSMSTIERRKKHIKMLLNVPEANNRQLLDEARDRGFIN